MKSKFGTLLLSVLIACGLWVYVVTNVSVTDTTSLHNVPVVFQNEGALTERNLMLTGGTSQTVTLNITGTRSEILKLRPDNVSVVVDLSRIYDAGRQSVGYVVNYPSDVVSGDFEWTADKTRIFLTVERWVEKYVSVSYSYEGKVEDGYMVDHETATVDQTRILVSGPASLVDPITQAKFVVNLEGQTQPVDQYFAYVLCDEEGEPVVVENIEQIQTDVDQIHFKLDVQRYKNIALKLDVIDGGGATEETTSIVLDTETIMISGPAEVVEELDALTLGTVDLSQIKETTTLTFPVQMPSGVTNRTGLESVNATISFPALITKTFTITNIQPINVPADTVENVVTKQINIKVRGPRTIVQRMQPSDLTVSVDFGDMEVGATVTRQPTVSISSNFADVGIMEIGSVTINLEEEPPETTAPEVDPASESDEESAADPATDPKKDNNGTTG